MGLIRLILQRHSQAAPSGIHINDFKRPLTPFGKELARARAAHLLKIGWVPDLALVSNAVRTKETWDEMKIILGGAIPTTYLESLYLGGLSELSSALLSCDKEAQTILALGHNPGWSDAASELSGIPTSLGECESALLYSRNLDWTKAILNTHGWEREDF